MMLKRLPEMSKVKTKMEIMAVNKDLHLWGREQVDQGQIRCVSYSDVKCIKQHLTALN